MPASYPSTVKTFNTKVNLTDIVDASHPNTVQDEVVAIETILGVNPQVSTTPNPATGFTAASTAYATLAARLANIENGIVGDSHTQYPKLSSFTAKGQVAVASGSGVLAALAAGANGQALVADSTTATGVKWAPVGKTTRIPHTFAVPGDILLPSGPDNVIPGFFVPVPAGQTVTLTAVRYVLGAGTATVSLGVNGTGATGYTAMSLTTTAATTSATAITLTADSLITPTVTAVAGAKNMSLSVYLDYSV